MADKGKGILRRVSSLEPGDYSTDIYNDWAEDYDHDLSETYGYVAPRIAAEAFAEYCPDKTVAIIDYGCGTGLAGEELHRLGYATIDGLDISTGMLQEAAKKQVYQNLIEGDLTTPLDIADEAYEAIICVGSFGNGHVGPENLPEIIRTVKRDGIIVIYLNAQPYVDDDYPTHFARLEQDSVWQILKTEASNYMETLDRPGWLIVARRPLIKN